MPTEDQAIQIIRSAENFIGRVRNIVARNGSESVLVQAAAAEAQRCEAAYDPCESIDGYVSYCFTGWPEPVMKLFGNIHNQFARIVKGIGIGPVVFEGVVCEVPRNVAGRIDTSALDALARNVGELKTAIVARWPSKVELSSAPPKRPKTSRRSKRTPTEYIEDISPHKIADPQLTLSAAAKKIGVDKSTITRLYNRESDPGGIFSAWWDDIERRQAGTPPKAPPNSPKRSAAAARDRLTRESRE